MTNNKIQMPANFVALNENEMSCVTDLLCFRPDVPQHLL